MKQGTRCGDNLMAELRLNDGSSKFSCRGFLSCQSTPYCIQTVYCLLKFPLLLFSPIFFRSRVKRVFRNLIFFGYFFHKFVFKCEAIFDISPYSRYFCLDIRCPDCPTMREKLLAFRLALSVKQRN